MGGVVGRVEESEVWCLRVTEARRGLRELWISRHSRHSAYMDRHIFRSIFRLLNFLRSHSSA